MIAGACVESSPGLVQHVVLWVTITNKQLTLQAALSLHRAANNLS